MCRSIARKAFSCWTISSPGAGLREEIAAAIRDVLQGGLYLSEAVLSRPRQVARAGRAVANRPCLNQLTPEQIQELVLIGERKTAAEAALRVRCGVRTVASRWRRLQTKLGLKNLAALTRCAICWITMSRT